MASIVIAREENIWLLWAKHVEDEAEEFFETRFELLEWEIGKNDVKKNSSAYLPHVPSPPGVLPLEKKNMVLYSERLSGVFLTLYSDKEKHLSDISKILLS